MCHKHTQFYKYYMDNSSRGKKKWKKQWLLTTNLYLCTASNIKLNWYHHASHMSASTAKSQLPDDVNKYNDATPRESHQYHSKPLSLPLPYDGSCCYNFDAVGGCGCCDAGTGWIRLVIFTDNADVATWNCHPMPLPTMNSGYWGQQWNCQVSE